MPCHTEFPTYPAVAMPALPEGFHDSSWRQNTCPSYTRNDDRATIWIDFPDVADREFDGYPRYCVVTGESTDADAPTIYADDWATALAVAIAAP